MTDREQLLAKLRASPEYRERWNEGAMARRIAKMTDQQVATALAMTEEQIAAAQQEAIESARWAPATGGGPAKLWDHVDMG